MVLGRGAINIGSGVPGAEGQEVVVVLGILLDKGDYLVRTLGLARRV